MHADTHTHTFSSARSPSLSHSHTHTQKVFTISSWKSRGARWSKRSRSRLLKNWLRVYRTGRPDSIPILKPIEGFSKIRQCSGCLCPPSRTSSVTSFRNHGWSQSNTSESPRGRHWYDSETRFDLFRSSLLARLSPFDAEPGKSCICYGGRACEHCAYCSHSEADTFSSFAEGLKGIDATRCSVSLSLFTHTHAHTQSLWTMEARDVTSPSKSAHINNLKFLMNLYFIARTLLIVSS